MVSSVVLPFNALFICAVFFLSGSVATNQKAENRLSHIPLHQGLNTIGSGSEIKTIRILNNADDYREVLADYSVESSKDVEFNQYQIVLIDLGIHPNAGYGTRINDVLAQSNHVVVEFTQLTSGQGYSYDGLKPIHTALKPLKA